MEGKEFQFIQLEALIQNNNIYKIG